MAASNINRTIFNRRLQRAPELDYSNIPGKPGRRDQRVIQILNNYGIDGRRCLDIGPGTGRWLHFLKHHGAAHIAAVDVSEEALARARQLGAECRSADLEHEPLAFPTDSFDITLSFMLLEHLKHPQLFVKEALRVTKQSGILLMTIPNIASFRSRLRLLLGFLPVAVSQDPTHVRFYRPRDLQRLFSPYGGVIEIIPTSCSLHPFDSRKWRVPTNRWLAGLDDHLLFRVTIAQ